jgi:hypothetical protein
MHTRSIALFVGASLLLVGVGCAPEDEITKPHKIDYAPEITTPVEIPMPVPRLIPKSTISPEALAEQEAPEEINPARDTTNEIPVLPPGPKPTGLIGEYVQRATYETKPFTGDDKEVDWSSPLISVHVASDKKFTYTVDFYVRSETYDMLKSTRPQLFYMGTIKNGPGEDEYTEHRYGTFTGNIAQLLREARQLKPGQVITEGEQIYKIDIWD